MNPAIGPWDGAASRPGRIEVASRNAHHHIHSERWVSHLVEVAWGREILLGPASQKSAKLLQSAENRPGIR
jgi:hypothetical protein